MIYRIAPLFILVLLFSCRKKPVDNPSPTTSEKWESGILVLNEGLFQQNNSTLGFLANGTSYQSTFFESRAGRPLGDTGNDLQVYGGKIYVVVNVSSTLEILDRKTGKFIKQVKMQNTNGAQQPRYVRFSGSKVFVSCYDGYVSVFDTTNVELQKRIQVGTNPEQMAVIGNHLFVSNSGGLNFPDVDSTVSVIDLTTLQETQKIVVGLNPGKIAATDNGKLFVHSRGDYAAVGSKLVEIDPISFEIESEIPSNFTQFETFGNRLLVVMESEDKVKIWDPVTSTIINENLIDLSGLQTFYSLQYDHANEKIYVFDARGYVNTGKIYQYDTNGASIFQFEAGLIPIRIYENN